ncbi:MAG: hypothetical protein RJA14_822 [Pseudomonadota bacterium]|jgi:hypothetical protein
MGKEPRDGGADVEAEGQNPVMFIVWLDTRTSA